ncbi:hypothetical protein ADUPG1_013733 [Aduncisulcus paluster]|uniref:Uncharacterized protein n=1 Tax=Aduncisulcus paluster TaxID=2918883 RepID=A0ABQ5K3Y1_9EUKA|nr:hypothetical protein ADUPG1_013733 [Aduncisulcus paluster]
MEKPYLVECHPLMDSSSGELPPSYQRNYRVPIDIDRITYTKRTTDCTSIQRDRTLLRAFEKDGKLTFQNLSLPFKTSCSVDFVYFSIKTKHRTQPKSLLFTFCLADGSSKAFRCSIIRRKRGKFWFSFRPQLENVVKCDISCEDSQSRTFSKACTFYSLLFRCRKDDPLVISREKEQKERESREIIVQTRLRMEEYPIRIQWEYMRGVSSPDVTIARIDFDKVSAVQPYFTETQLVSFLTEKKYHNFIEFHSVEYHFIEPVCLETVDIVNYLPYSVSSLDVLYFTEDLGIIRKSYRIFENDTYQSIYVHQKYIPLPASINNVMKCKLICNISKIGTEWCSVQHVRFVVNELRQKVLDRRKQVLSKLETQYKAIWDL